MRTLRALPVCGAPSDLSTVLQDTWRCFSWSELAAIASDHAARRALSDGHVVRLAPNAYCGAMHARSFAARADAVASWLHGVAVLGGASSLYVARVIDEPPHLVDVTVKSSTSIASRPPWLRVTHASYALETAVIGGWTVAHPATALCQAYGRLSVSERDAVVLRAFQTRRLSADDVRAALARMPRVKDRRALERVVRAFERGAESVLEMRALDEVFAGPEWSELVRQHDVTTRAGRFRSRRVPRRNQDSVRVRRSRVPRGPHEVAAGPQSRRGARCGGDPGGEVHQSRPHRGSGVVSRYCAACSCARAGAGEGAGASSQRVAEIWRKESRHAQRLHRHRRTGRLAAGGG